MQKVQNIIFDLGGVIINLDPHKTFAAFRKHKIDNIQFIYRKLSQDGILHDIDTGKIGLEEFLPIIQNLGSENITQENLTYCWNSMLLDIPRQRLHLLEKLKNKYRLFLCSNTNQVHLDHINSYLTKTYRNSPIDNWFHKAYYSHLTGMRKPDPQIYQLIVDENNLHPENTLFLDDNLPNLESASTLGIQTRHITNQTCMMSVCSGLIQ